MDTGRGVRAGVRACGCAMPRSWVCESCLPGRHPSRHNQDVDADCSQLSGQAPHPHPLTLPPLQADPPLNPSPTDDRPIPRLVCIYALFLIIDVDFSLQCHCRRLPTRRGTDNAASPWLKACYLLTAIPVSNHLHLSLPLPKPLP